MNENFRASEGRNFMGSRDIDLGFHIDPSWTDSELKDSVFARTLARIEQVGFRPLSFRFVKRFHAETRRELSDEQAKRVSQSFIFDMYIDPIVDVIHPRAKPVFGFVPVDEPLLSQVFTGKKFVSRDEYGARLMLPRPAVLLATKLNSVSNRDKEHKRIKDIADIYGLVWYSGDELGDLKRELFEMVDREKVASVVSSFREEDYSSVARNLGTEQAEVSRVLSELKT